jgi:hypothetical protein
MTEPRFLLNPNARVKRIERDGRTERLELRAPIRGEALLTSELSDTSQEVAFRCLLRSLAGDADATLELNPTEQAALRTVGVLLREEQISRPVRFEVPGTPESFLREGALVAADREAPLVGAETTVWRQASPQSALHPWRVDATAQQPEERKPELEALMRAADEIRRDGYAVVDACFPTVQLAALQGYYAALAAEGWMSLDQRKRFWSYNEPVARNLQRRVLPWLHPILGAVRPSYTYAMRYLAGAQLEEHTDRAQCEYTVALLLDFEGDMASPSPWPLLLRSGSARATVHQRVGEVIVFRGRQLAHSRPTLEGLGHSTSVLLHYVDADFVGSLD